MTRPAVSVVVCCYNAAATLPRTLDSLQAQTFHDFEILAIDDRSRDSTVAVLHDHAAHEPRLRVLENPGNRGTALTRQRGLEEARADLVMFVDSDDIPDPALIARLHDTLTADPCLIGVGCYATYFTEEGKDLGLQRVGPESRDAFERIHREAKLLFMVPCTLFRKADALAVGGYRQVVMPNADGIRYEDFSEDLDLWCRMSDLGAEGRYFLTLPESLLRYRKPLDSLSTKNLTHMQLKMRWVKDCLRRRRAGQPERSLAEFIASRGTGERFSDWRSDKAAAFYKRAGFAYAKRNFAGLAWYLLLTGLMSPKLIRQKIATQKVTR
ncbi:glycosyltransferase family 2 protein [Antarcticimicrobium sediminis]|uniref:Glycosyltransferase family 2 protein n=1 Tax=Antarcticimicrobium sediminis TaxID=2546227 RepID=A0A4R5EHE9_9RHOB|nr:glycosyltransferase family A protein [Antarcticimicrobium sediminis]TDE33712.1 glycosyltransferase family 2 protein [Antarcticimicrobium sediminis]